MPPPTHICPTPFPQKGFWFSLSSRPSLAHVCAGRTLPTTGRQRPLPPPAPCGWGPGFMAFCCPFHSSCFLGHSQSSPSGPGVRLDVGHTAAHRSRKTVPARMRRASASTEHANGPWSGSPSVPGIRQIPSAARRGVQGRGHLQSGLQAHLERSSFPPSGICQSKSDPLLCQICPLSLPRADSTK